MTTTWWRKDRDPATVFVDYNQNARDHTIAAAYSVRGVPDGTVSTPIIWEEIDTVEPRDCTMATVLARFAELGDLHAGIDAAVFRIDELLEWAARTSVPESPTPLHPTGDVRSAGRDAGRRGDRVEVQRRLSRVRR